ncbi:MAG: FAD-dependent oxidoreductase [Lachnospiraceae bacterium]|nr:FAD-dependent oxidoreductase [Lachnospiraceae bacterium]
MDNINIYDTIIIGSGPAGMAAAIYAARAELNFCVIEKSYASGGQVLTTYEVDNYPGLPGLSGGELSDNFKKHCDKLGCTFITADITDITPGHIAPNGFFNEIDLSNKGLDSVIDLIFMLTTTEGDAFLTKTIIAATGATHRKAGIEGEDRFAGVGVSYCATCDGAFFRKKDTAVIGGGDVALEDAIFLSRLCNKVYLVHRRDEFRAAKALVSAADKIDNIEFVFDSVAKNITGNSNVEALTIKNGKTFEERTLPVSGVFIAIGIVPETELFRNLVACDEAGYILADESGKTSMPGIFAAGDIRKKPLRQIITAAADGANCVTSVETYLMK